MGKSNSTRAKSSKVVGGTAFSPGVDEAKQPPRCLNTQAPEQELQNSRPGTWQPYAIDRLLLVLGRARLGALGRNVTIVGRTALEEIGVLAVGVCCVLIVRLAKDLAGLEDFLTRLINQVMVALVGLR